MEKYPEKKSKFSKQRPTNQNKTEKLVKMYVRFYSHNI